MVHRDGQEHLDRGRYRDRHAARRRSAHATRGADQGDTRWVPEQGENRITGMIESKPDWVISRQRAWGVPITVFVHETHDGNVDILNDEGVNDASPKPSRRKARTPGTPTARANASSARSPTRTGRRSTTFSTSGSIQARRTRSFSRTRSTFRRSPASSASPRWWQGYGDVSRRVGSASRLVSFLTDRKLRHARSRALRCRADPWLRPRRGRPQDVEVARQRRRAAGRDQAGRRRHSAHVGVRVGLCRRSAHRTGNSEDDGRDLSQAAQHPALDARQPRAFPAGRSQSRSTRCRNSNG